MVLSDSGDTMVAKINLITPQFSTNVYNFIIHLPFLLTRRLSSPHRSNTVNTNNVLSIYMLAHRDNELIKSDTSIICKDFPVTLILNIYLNFTLQITLEL